MKTNLISKYLTKIKQHSERHAPLAAAHNTKVRAYFSTHLLHHLQLCVKLREIKDLQLINNLK